MNKVEESGYLDKIAPDLTIKEVAEMLAKYGLELRVKPTKKEGEKK